MNRGRQLHRVRASATKPRAAWPMLHGCRVLYVVCFHSGREGMRSYQLNDHLAQWSRIVGASDEFDADSLKVRSTGPNWPELTALHALAPPLHHPYAV